MSTLPHHDDLQNGQAFPDAHLNDPNGHPNSTEDRSGPAAFPSVHLGRESVGQRWAILRHAQRSRESILDPHTYATLEHYQSSIENVIGTVKVPVGIAGPLRVNGLFAQGDYFVPLATTEAALVASYSRGAEVITTAGGCAVLLLHDGMTRTPGFAFANLREVRVFVAWVRSHHDAFTREAEATTRHGTLTNIGLTVEGNHVYVTLEFSTGDAAGQNMVTIATEAVCDYIDRHAPITPQYFTLEANVSGDKKASARSFVSTRGKNATAEVIVPAVLVEQRLHTTVERMVNAWRLGAIGGVLSGTIGIQGHYANGLAALYLACGQDVACVAESAVGITRFEMTSRGELYAAVTLPNLVVGTVGGGTGLPSQRACLAIMGVTGSGQARVLAEICAGLCLAGEISLIAALAAGDFARAHRCLARGRSTRRKSAGTTYADNLSP